MYMRNVEGPIPRKTPKQQEMPTIRVAKRKENPGKKLDPPGPRVVSNYPPLGLGPNQQLIYFAFVRLDLVLSGFGVVRSTCPSRLLRVQTQGT